MVSLMAGIMSLFLPVETAGKEMPDTIVSVELTSPKPPKAKDIMDQSLLHSVTDES